MSFYLRLLSFMNYPVALLAVKENVGWSKKIMFIFGPPCVKVMYYL